MQDVFCLYGSGGILPNRQYARMAPNRIKELRESQGMTLETLAELVGLSTSYVQRLENGERNLAVKHFAAFATALRVKPEDLIKETSSREQVLIKAILKADSATQAVIARLLGIDLGAIQPELPSSHEEENSANEK
ncbi:helix-turn-helix domain-containing protein [Nitrobacter sp. Nb-311A]|uniref:helix-turn-helix domain-containing protein n=1 Tax=Nitrobacter sp. Nb-311A TaxID=314253 RepID=UPI000594EFE0|nr:helix-turn-helix transcriptional regulator [Nitrobacter sp. Nb-311A]